MAHHPVILYATPGCPTCETARRFLQERGVEFTELDATSDARIVRDLLRLAGAAVVPTILVGDDAQVGWDQARVAEMIDDPLPDEEDQLTVIFREIEQQLREEEGREVQAVQEVQEVQEVHEGDEVRKVQEVEEVADGRRR